MTEKKTVLTYDGLVKLEEEVQELKVVRRREVADKIKAARAQGDLSENAEYDSAKEEQAELEARIALIESMLRNAEVIDEDEVDTEHINLGCRVKLYDEEFEEEVEYLLIGSAEANPAEGSISNESPLGIAILGKKVGERAKVEAPAGVSYYKVLEINRN